MNQPLSLPSDFIQTIHNVFQEDGKRFIENLPGFIDEAAAQWNLTDIQPLPELSYNFVAFARRGEVLSPHDMIEPQTKGRGDPAPTHDVVLKMGVPNREIKSEMAALKLFNGEGACKLLDYDEDKCWMLLEKLNPGVMLSTLEDDEEATHIAAEVMKRIWVPLDSARLLAKSQEQEKPRKQASGLQSPFIQLTDWFDGLKKLRKKFNGGTGPLDGKLVERVESSVMDFFAENHNPVLMHGDFHHYNILSSERGWLVIDPKGVIGPAGYEVGPFMLNPWGKFSDGINRQLILRRIDILHEHLRFERGRILEWSLAHAVLSAWWSIEDNTGWEYALQVAQLFASL